MKRVTIMCRVSSDEQAKGYSLDDQLEKLTAYCEKNQYQIIYVIREDHSAKSFDRPEWKKWLNLVKKGQLHTDELLITSWDRFSRDLTGSLNMIRYLKSKNITVQAIEQPIDDSIPENLIMHAVYLASPDVDNRRRAIKIKGGIRQALKQGRWIRKALVGYKNARDEDNKPIMVIDPETGPLIRYAFEQLAEGVSQTDLRKELEEKGLKIAKSNFSRLFRREAYMGKITVPANEDEPEMIVESLHEALISEELFYRVQQVLTNGIKQGNKVAKTITRRDELPLRGYLTCSNCGENHTGSRSRGKLGKRYFYYHCNYCRKERYSAPQLNKEVAEMLGKFQVSNNVKNLYSAILKKLLKNSGINSEQEVIKLKQKLQKENARLVNLQDMLADREISSEDYKSMKARYTANINELKTKIEQLNSNKGDIEKHVNSGLNILQNLRNTYEKATTELKQKILGSIFPEKLSFDGKNCRTPKINSAILLILSISNGFGTNKNEQSLFQKQLFAWVEPEGIEPSS